MSGTRPGWIFVQLRRLSHRAPRGDRDLILAGRISSAPGCGAMDDAVGDLKQALPCVAESPAVHVEVLQRSGR